MHGLDDAALGRQPLATSALSLAGIVRHLAVVERWYFQGTLGQRFPGELYDDATDAAFTDAHTSSPDEAFGTWAREVEVSRSIIDGLALDDVRTNPDNNQQHSMVWVLTHMIDEYARHLGHADLLREAVDGSTGE